MKIPSIDGLRALSILFVIHTHAKLSVHYPVVVGKYFPYGGDFGVTVFFVISGFLITTLLFEEKERFGKVDLKGFYIRRVLRIFPVYYLFILVVALINFFQGLEMPGDFFAHALTYTTNFNLSEMWTHEDHVHWLLGHTWSLAVEEQFYLVWPLVLFLDRKKVFWVIIGCLLLSPMTRILTVLYRPYKIFFLADFFNYSDSIIWGALMAYLVKYKAELFIDKIKFSGWMRIFILILVAVVNLYGNKVPALNAPFSRTILSAAVAYLMLSTLFVKDDWVYRFLNHRYVVSIGIISYSLYIWQQLFLYNNEWLHGDVWYRQFPINVLCVFVVAALSYHLYEKQFLKLKNKFKHV